jgi:hypothetical protein
MFELQRETRVSGKDLSQLFSTMRADAWRWFDYQW